MLPYCLLLPCWILFAWGQLRELIALQTIRDLPRVRLLTKLRGHLKMSLAIQVIMAIQILFMFITEWYREPFVTVRPILPNTIHSCLFMMWFQARFLRYFPWLHFSYDLLRVCIMCFETLTLRFFLICLLYNF